MTSTPAPAVRLLAGAAGCFLLALAPGLPLATALAQTAPTPAPTASAPAQRPLLSRSGGVKPNVMLTLDVSNSMRFQHMPEGTAVIGTATVPSPAATVSTRFHPADNGPQAYHPDFSEGSQYSAQGAVLSQGQGVVAGVPGATSAWTQRWLRSADTNPVYYNPQVRYQPWRRPDGTRFPPAVVTAAALDPVASLGTVNLATTYTAFGATWCHTPTVPTGCEYPQWVTVDTGGGRGRGGRGGGSVGDVQLVPKSLAFSPGLYYRLKKSGSAFLDPMQAASYDEFDINQLPASGGYPKYPARTDCTGRDCTQEQERQNFANWFVYYRSRLLFAKASLGEALYSLDNAFRIGYGRTSKQELTDVDGTSLRIVESGVRDYTADRQKAVMDWLYALQSDWGTPLRLAVQEVGRYYQSDLSTGPWSDAPGTGATTPMKACRRAYHVLVTDGYWTDIDKDYIARVGDTDSTEGSPITGPNGREWTYQPVRPFRAESSDTLADFAMAYWKKDLVPSLANSVPPSAANPAFWQSMTNFMVGLGVRGLLDPTRDLPELTRPDGKSWGTDQIDDLWHAAVNSRGEYFSAQTPEQLGSALYTAIRKAVERELREAGVATATATLETGNRKYIPSYRSGVWNGDVEAYDLTARGLTGARLWSARERLPAAGLRRVFTWDAGRAIPAAVPFQWESLSTAARAQLADGYRDAGFVDFIRGDRSREGGASGYRVRESVLGDFVNSTPVFAREGAEPSNTLLPAGGSSYADFVQKTKATRAGVLWAGGNDGMLHGFRDTRGTEAALDGAEVFAYVPGAVLGSLQVLAMPSYGSVANEHRYFVDGPLREADLWVPKPGGSEPEWRNYLFGSTGAGARAVFALDITDPAALGASSVRWELSAGTQEELGYVTFPIASGQLPNGRSVALFGNGYGSKSGIARLFVVDAATGRVTTVPVAPSVAGNGLGGVAVVRNALGQVVTLYAGDLRGNLWRFDYDARSEGFTAGSAAVFAAGTVQPILQPPMVFPHDKGGQLVVFGTGRLLTEGDASDTTLQAVYGVHDRPGDAVARPLGRSQLVGRTIQAVSGTGDRSEQAFFDLAGEAIDWEARRGWYFDLDVAGYPGLRMVYPLQQAWSRIVLVSAVAPAGTADGCEATTGRGINFLVPVDTGRGPEQPVFDSNGDGVFDTRDSPHAGYAVSADGADAVVSAGIGGVGGGGGTAGSGSTPCLLISLQNTTGQMSACYTPTAGRQVVDRIWWRVLNAPL